MDLRDIIEIREIQNTNEANQYLERGWVLLGLAAHRESSPSIYVGAVTKHIAERAKEIQADA
jgi:hypothetical protein